MNKLIVYARFSRRGEGYREWAERRSEKRIRGAKPHEGLEIFNGLGLIELYF